MKLVESELLRQVLNEMTAFRNILPLNRKKTVLLSSSVSLAAVAVSVATWPAALATWFLVSEVAISEGICESACGRFSGVPRKAA